MPESVTALAPDAASHLERLIAAASAAFDPHLLEVLERRVAALLGDSTIVIAAYPKGSIERSAIDLLEQMVIDVGGVTPDMLDAVTAHVGTDRLRDFVTAVYLVEFGARLQIVAAQLLPDARAASSSPAPISADVSIRQLVGDYAASVMRMRALDPVTTELVRLRCARTHHCRICQTLRLGEARQAGVDETVADKVDFYERSDLDERSKVALRVTDAFIIRPDELAADTVERARSMFTVEELAELCLDIIKWSVQKIHVALGTDGADGVAIGTPLEFDDDGRPLAYR